MEISTYSGPFDWLDEYLFSSRAVDHLYSESWTLDWRDEESWCSGAFPVEAALLREAVLGLGLPSQRPADISRFAQLSATMWALVDGPFLLVVDARSRRVLVSQLPHVSPGSTKRRQILLAANLVLLTRHAGGIVHGSVVSFGDTAAAFLGPSGAGKSTSASLLARTGAPVADDLFVACVGGSGPAAFPVGLDRFYSSPVRHRLGGIFLPTKARRFALTRLTARDAFLRYLSENSADLAMLPVAVRRMYIPWLHSLFLASPAFDLAFPRDHIDLDAVVGALEPGPDAGSTERASLAS